MEQAQTDEECEEYEGSDEEETGSSINVHAPVQPPPAWKRVWLQFSFFGQLLFSSFPYLGTSCFLCLWHTQLQQVPCRYGRGCTHKADETHCLRYWHPPVPPEAMDIGEHRGHFSRQFVRRLIYRLQDKEGLFSIAIE